MESESAIALKLPLDLWRSIKLAPDDPGSSGLRPTILTPSGLRRTEPSSG